MRRVGSMNQGPAVLIPASAAEAIELYGSGDNTTIVGGGKVTVKNLQMVMRCTDSSTGATIENWTGAVTY